MKEIRKTSQFKKDYKRFKNDKEFVETLMEIVKLLKFPTLLFRGFQVFVTPE